MNYNYRNLVFEGGGVKGIAYGGALAELDKRGMLSKIERVAGTSAGAITACLLAIGYTTDQITEIIGQTDFKKFEDNTTFFIRDIFRLIQKFGWNKGDAFKEWISKLIEAKIGSKNFTFKQLQEKIEAGTPGFKFLYIVCTNVTKQKAEILSHEKYPDMNIADAVRMSMSIPIYFASVKNSSGEVIVDGGLTMNYPVQIFDNIKYINNSSNSIRVNYNTDDDYLFNYETLGFRVDSAQERNYVNPSWEGDPSMTKNLKKFVLALINFTMEMVNKKHLHTNDWNRTVFIDSCDVKSTDFKLDKDKINLLVSNGGKAINDYFKWKDNDLRWSMFPK